MPAEKDDERAELIGDESDSDLDPLDHEMIDSGKTQIEVRVEGGSRTITILVSHDLLKNTEDVVQAFGPFCSDAEHRTLEELSDGTLSKSIAGLALRGNRFLHFSLLLYYFGSLTNLTLLTIFPFICRPLSWTLRVCGERRGRRRSTAKYG